jgi:hypothetical protein
MEDIRTREQAKRHVEKLITETVEDFMIALREGDLPMTEAQLELDFRAFLCGHLEVSDEDETVGTVDA